MGAVDGDGIDEDLTRAVSVAMISAARAGEQLSRMNQTAAREREARAAGDMVEAQRQLEAHTESARAYFEVVTRPEYLTAATGEQIQEIHQQAQAWRQRLPEAQRALNAAPTARTSAAGDLEWATVLATEADENDRRAASQPRHPLSNTIGEPDPLASESTRAQGATVEGADAASTAQVAQARPAREAPGARITSRRPRGPRPLAATRDRQFGVDC